MSTPEQESAAMWGPPPTDAPRSLAEIHAEVYGDGDNPDDMDRMVQLTTPNKAPDILSLPTVQLTKEQFDYLSAANPDGPRASVEEIQTFLDTQGLTGSEAIATIEGIGTRVIDTTFEDFGTTERELTDQLLDMMNASEQETADAFAVENGQKATVTEAAVDPSEGSQIDDAIDPDARLVTREQRQQMRAILDARAATEAAYANVPVQTEAVFSGTSKEEIVADRVREVKQEKYDALAELKKEKKLSDDDISHLESYARAFIGMRQAQREGNGQESRDEQERMGWHLKQMTSKAEDIRTHFTELYMVQNK